MKITLTIPTPRGSKPGSTDWVMVQAIVDAHQKCIAQAGIWGIDAKLAAILKAAKVEKSL